MSAAETKGKVMFYHLTQHSPAALIRRLSERVIAGGGRVMLRSKDQRQLRHLDEALWAGQTSFLPHGLESQPHAEDQPLLLGQAKAVNGAKVIMLMAGEEVDPNEAQEADRLCYLFEDADDFQVQAARAQWRAVVAAGLVAEYWADASGAWEMKAQSGQSG